MKCRQIPVSDGDTAVKCGDLTAQGFFHKLGRGGVYDLLDGGIIL